MASFRARSGSLLVDRGLDLRTPPFGFDVGQIDFFRTQIPMLRGFDIGAHEVDPTQGCPVNQ
jgi:hypothetical protein